MIKVITKGAYSEAPLCKMTIYGLEDTDLYKFSRQLATDLVTARAYNGSNKPIEARNGRKALEIKRENVKYKRVNLGSYPISMKITVTQIIILTIIIETIVMGI